MSSIGANEPSLSSKAMLCSLSISMWSARKHDQEASEEIASRHGAGSDAGRYNKLLLPKQALAEIQKIASEARHEHYCWTLPWANDGYRILSSAAYWDHTTKMTELRNRFDPAVDRFIDRFEELIRDARKRLGTLFRDDDYPSVAELRSKFSFATEVRPLPDEADFRVGLGREEKERIQRQIKATVEASMKVASLDLWQRLYDAVSHMAERLQGYKVTENGVEHPFRDTVVTNLTKLVDVLPKLNITQDPELDHMTEQVRELLLVDPGDLRESDSIRTETAKAASEIATHMAGYMGYGNPAAVPPDSAAKVTYKRGAAA